MKKYDVKVGIVDCLSRKVKKANKKNSNKKIRKAGKKLRLQLQQGE
tara:strand:+ start:833 stop:970 length:138 start_codon:yes stop_codon:yes gene_type:complete